MNHFHPEHQDSISATIGGFMVAIIDHGQSLLTLLGIVIGTGGLITALSREIRGWIELAQDRKNQQ